MQSAATSPRTQANQRGAAMVEMALALPIYFLLVYGVIQLSFVLFGFCNATYACRMAARYAAVHGAGSTSACTSAQLKTIVMRYLWGAPSTGTTVNSTWTPDNNPGSTVTVSITIIYPTAIPFSSLSQVTVGTSDQAIILQ
jgi:Flp pilus assembly protein TadG